MADDLQLHAEILGDRFRSIAGAVGGAVVDDDHVESVGELWQDLVDMRKQPAKVLALVVGGHDEAQAREPAFRW